MVSLQEARQVRAREFWKAKHGDKYPEWRAEQERLHKAGRTHYGMRWYIIRNRMMQEYAEIWRTADKVELMSCYDFNQPEPRRNVHVFAVPLAELTKHYFTAP